MAPHMQPAAPPPPPMWPPQQPPPSNERRGPWLAIAIIVLAIAVGGAAVAVVLSRQGSDARLAANTITPQTVTVPATTPAPSSSSTETTSTPGSTITATTPPSNGQLPGGSNQQLASEIQPMLLEWHEDVVHNNFHAAWELLSHRKQIQDEREYGYSTWVKNQSNSQPISQSIGPAGVGGKDRTQ